MVINGFLKMTLLDFPGKVACTVFTAGCNMRCPFCHNASLVTETDASERIDEEDIFAYLKKRKGILDGVAITGGEPLLHADIKDFIGRVKDMGFAVKLDTNGTFPERLEELIEGGYIDYAAMDIKNCPDRYAETAGVKNLDLSPIQKSVELLLSGGIDYEFRTTIVRQFHDAKSIEKAAEWISGAKRYFLQAFKDSGNLIGENLSGLNREEMLLLKAAAQKYVPATEIRGI